MKDFWTLWFCASTSILLVCGAMVIHIVFGNHADPLSVVQRLDVHASGYGTVVTAEVDGYGTLHIRCQLEEPDNAD